MTKDPKQNMLPAMRHLRNAQKLNRYSYVLNNPLKFIDIWGLEAGLSGGGAFGDGGPGGAGPGGDGSGKDEREPPEPEENDPDYGYDPPEEDEEDSEEDGGG